MPKIQVNMYQGNSHIICSMIKHICLMIKYTRESICKVLQLYLLSIYFQTLFSIINLLSILLLLTTTAMGLSWHAFQCIDPTMICNCRLGHPEQASGREGELNEWNTQTQFGTPSSSSSLQEKTSSIQGLCFLCCLVCLV